MSMTIKKMQVERKMKKKGNNTIVEARQRLETEVQDSEDANQRLKHTSRELEDLTSTLRTVLIFEGVAGQQQNKKIDFDTQSDIMSRGGSMRSTRQNMMLDALGDFDENELAMMETLTQSNRASSIQSFEQNGEDTLVKASTSTMGSVRPSPRTVPVQAS